MAPVTTRTHGVSIDSVRPLKIVGGRSHFSDTVSTTPETVRLSPRGSAKIRCWYKIVATKKRDKEMRASGTSNVVLVLFGAGLASVYGCSSEATPPVYGTTAGTTSTPG